MGKVLILGAGELGKQIRHFVSNCSEHQFVGFLDDFGSAEDILGKMSEIDTFKDQIDYVAIGIGYFHLEFKNRLFKQLKEKGFDLLTFVHPSCIVDATAKIGEGSILFPGVIVDQRSQIGQNTILNCGVIVSHDCNIGDHSFVAPGVVFSGRCTLGDMCFVGSGSVLKNDVSITENVTIGAGSLVLKSIEKNGKYFGHPVKYIG